MDNILRETAQIFWMELKRGRKGSKEGQKEIRLLA